MASKSSKTYWAERAAIREKESYLHGAELSDALFRQYELAAASIRREISDFYAKYAAKYGITYDDAVRFLTKTETREWKRTLEAYQAEINATTDKKVKMRLTARLDALSTNSQITRLEALEGKIDLTLNRLYDRGVAEMKQAFGALFVEACYKKHYDIQSRANIFAEIADINEEVVENALSYPWSGAMFSDRLWRNKEQLLFSTRQILTQGCIQGKSIDAMTQALAGQMGQSYKAAERLIRTETSHFHNEASKQAYEAAGIDEFEFLASLSERTCEVCGNLDHQHFPRKDALTGTNYPPMHPNCRCTTISYDPDREKIYQMSGIEMPHEMTYAEWKAEQDRRHGDGWVDRERKKAYNRKADMEQFEAYSKHLGADAPPDIDAFQTLKYSKPDEWAELKALYSYKRRVPEATKTDFKLYQKIKGTGLYGTIRVPPAPIDVSPLWLNANHVIDHGHSVTEAEAKSFIENAVFSLKRKHWTGNIFTNYYSPEGAAYVLTSENEIRTAFKREQFKGHVKDAMEAIENEK